MRKFTFIIFTIVILFSCREQVKEQPLSIQRNNLLGEWSSKDEENFLLFKDTVCLPFNFYTNWKLDSNKLQIYGLESMSGKDSIWINYLITNFSEDSLVLTSSVFNSDSSEVILYHRKAGTKNNVDYINLIRPIYPGERSIIEINVKGNGEVTFKEVTKENETFVRTCSFDNQEMNILNSMIDRINFSDINPSYISGISDQDYYSLEISSLTPKDTLRVIVDTGYVSPNMVSRVITYIFTTTKLKCTPERYNNWRMYYNPIFP